MMSGKLTEAEQAILDLIKAAPDGRTVGEIAQALDSTSASVKVLINRLRKKGQPISSPRRGPSRIRQPYRLEG
jgi:DNA-binding MarR family transcriptional regulator